MNQLSNLLSVYDRSRLESTSDDEIFTARLYVQRMFSEHCSESEPQMMKNGTVEVLFGIALCVFKGGLANHLGFFLNNNKLIKKSHSSIYYYV